MIISIAICLWAYSSIVNTGKGVNSRYLRKQLHRLPYQENRFRGGSNQSGNDPPGGPSGSRYRREHIIVDDPELGGPPSGIRIERPLRRPGNLEGASLSSSSASSMQAHERRHKAPAPRQRTQSNMMYTRRRTPQSSFLQNPSASHSYGPRQRSYTRPHDSFMKYDESGRPGRRMPSYGGPRRGGPSQAAFRDAEVRIDPRTREESRRTEDARMREEVDFREQER